MVKKGNKRVQITMDERNYKFWKEYCKDIGMTLSEVINKELEYKYFMEGLGKND